MVNQDMQPFYRLVYSRMNDLGISSGDLVRRCGYSNVSKGLRRLNEILAGNLDGESHQRIIAAMPSALELDDTTIQSAVLESKRLLETSVRKSQEEADSAWRSSFQPEAYLVGTATVPTQITFYGLTGGANRWLRIQLDITNDPGTFSHQALAVVRETPIVPFFGPAAGFVVNYAPDKSILFDLSGKIVGVLDQAYIPGEVSVSIGKRAIGI